MERFNGGSPANGLRCLARAAAQARRVTAPLRLMAILAHPDDESLGIGGILARYAAEGVETSVVTATLGQRGRFFDNSDRPDDAEVGRVREAELRRAARVLGVREVHPLGYMDGALDRVDPAEIVPRIAAHIRRLRPQVVVTFDPFGAYGHPDHIAISQLAAAAIVAAAAPQDGAAGVDGDGGAAALEAHPPHAVSKLYYIAWGAEPWATYQQAFKKLVSRVDGEERQAAPWPGWSITTRVDARAQWQRVWRAVQCHETQMAMYQRLGELTEEHHQALWGEQSFYRVFSTVNGGRETETDLFDGLRG